MKTYIIEYSIPGMFTFFPMTTEITAPTVTEAMSIFETTKGESWVFVNISEK